MHLLRRRRAWASPPGGIAETLDTIIVSYGSLRVLHRKLDGGAIRNANSWQIVFEVT